MQQSASVRTGTLTLTRTGRVERFGRRQAAAERALELRVELEAAERRREVDLERRGLASVRVIHDLVAAGDDLHHSYTCPMSIRIARAAHLLIAQSHRAERVPATGRKKTGREWRLKRRAPEMSCSVRRIRSS